MPKLHPHRGNIASPYKNHGLSLILTGSPGGDISHGSGPAPGDPRGPPRPRQLAQLHASLIADGLAASPRGTGLAVAGELQALQQGAAFLRRPRELQGTPGNASWEMVR